MPKLRSLRVVVVACDDEASLPDLLQRAAEAAAGASDDWGITVIDNGSADSTQLALSELIPKMPRVTVLRHAAREPVADTIREVLLLADKEWTLLIPGDGQIPPEEIHRLIPFSGRYDLIYAWRGQRADSLGERIASWLYNAAASLALFYRLHDIGSALLFRAGALKEIRLDSKTPFVTAELLAKARQKGLKHVEIPVSHEPEMGESRRITRSVAFATASEFLFLAPRLFLRRVR